jgi:hypothetical protein
VEPGAEPERQPVYDTIQVDEWGKRRAAENAAERLRTLLNHRLSTTENISVLLSHDADNGMEMKLVVESSTWKERGELLSTADASPSVLERKVPKAVSGEVSAPQNNPGAGRQVKNIPVEIEESTRHYAASCGDYYNKDYGTDIPGGCNVGQGTVATPAYSYDLNETVMVSAGHVVDATGDTTQGPDSDKDLDAWAYQTYKGDDHGYYRAYDNEDFIYQLASKPDTYIAGIVSWDSIKNNAGRTDYDVAKQGGKTGTTTGYVNKIADTDVPIYKTTCTGHYGDSGGAIYQRAEFPDRADEVYMLGPLGYGWDTDGLDKDDECPCLENTGGNPIGYVEDELNLSV